MTYLSISLLETGMRYLERQTCTSYYDIACKFKLPGQQHDTSD
jgi:hypothetical protein